MSTTIEIPSPTISAPRTSPVKVTVARNQTGKHIQAQMQSTTDASSQKSAHVQGQVDEVIGIMHSNIDKVVQRGENLNSLQNKTDELNQGALQFKRGTTTLKNEMQVQYYLYLED
ncbi:hypothetical protein, variant [Batrachochytrium dendrobatidis JEL423]|uniref:V-SNARE coiled-coil homology domain-containing protein n=1 Tax=Batrachochytrium dendrobatidis (strain JEL423) TaxID=403673 RepID=A0A177WDZ7_BATDL|nr:hypothetical protein, variant [Batrachochytrium dendrobatidis JEL423]